MSEDLRLNGSGYIDNTAYLAMKKCDTGDEKMDVKRGEIWEIEQSNGTVKEVLCIQPFDGYFEHLMLSNRVPGKNAIEVRSREMMYADAGRVSYSLTSRAATYIRTVPDHEMEDILHAIAEALEIEPTVAAPTMEHARFLIELEKERDIYKNMYIDLLEKVIGGGRI